MISWAEVILWLYGFLTGVIFSAAWRARRRNTRCGCDPAEPIAIHDVLMDMVEREREENENAV